MNCDALKAAPLIGRISFGNSSLVVKAQEPFFPPFFHHPDLSPSSDCRILDETFLFPYFLNVIREPAVQSDKIDGDFSVPLSFKKIREQKSLS